MGSCANGGGYYTLLVLGGARLRPHVPVDIYVPAAADRRGALFTEFPSCREDQAAAGSSRDEALAHERIGTRPETAMTLQALQ